MAPGPRGAVAAGIAWGSAVRDAANACAAEAVLSETRPDILYDKGERILKRKREEDAAQVTVGEGYAREDFRNDAPDLPFEEKAVVLFGPSGTGKTSYAVALLKDPLVCSTLDDLKRFRPGVHGGIVFDDMDFSGMTPEAAIHLLDMVFDRTIRLRYTNAQIPRGTPRVFTTNKQPRYVFPRPINAGQEAALLRRYTAVHVEQQLFVLEPEDE